MSRIDRRKLRSEQKITDALCEMLGNYNQRFNIRPRDLYKKARVSSATFYRHYKNVDEVLELRINKAKKEYKVLVAKSLLKDVRNGWARIILFVYKNRDLFEILWTIGDIRFIGWMMDEIRGEIVAFWPNYRRGKIDKFFELFTHEVAAVVWLWAKFKFDKNYLDEVIDEITRLMMGAGKRFGGL